CQALGETFGALRVGALRDDRQLTRTKRSNRVRGAPGRAQHLGEPLHHIAVPTADDVEAVCIAEEGGDDQASERLLLSIRLRADLARPAGESTEIVESGEFVEKAVLTDAVSGLL